MFRLEIGIPVALPDTVEGKPSDGGSYPAEALLQQRVGIGKPAELGGISGIAAVFRQGHS